MNHFWTHKDNIPDGMGYGQFTVKHLIWLVLTAAFVIITAVCYGQADSAQKILILRVIAASLIIIDIIKKSLVANINDRIPYKTIVDFEPLKTAKESVKIVKKALEDFPPSYRDKYQEKCHIKVEEEKTVYEGGRGILKIIESKKGDIYAFKQNKYNELYGLF